MVKGIDTLIRLSKRALDELRKKQALLENQKTRYEQAIKKLNDEMEKEMRLAEKTPEMGSFFGGFAKHIRHKQDKLRVDIKKVEADLDAMTDEIQDAFADLKKYEIAKEQAELRAKAEESRKETIAMDEVAAIQFTRKNNEDA